MNFSLCSVPAGWKFAGGVAGIKESGSADLMVAVSDRPASAAGVFTRNLVVGAPVTVGRGRVPAGAVRGVVINSGNANTGTGAKGLEDARAMTRTLAGEIGCDEGDVLVCSTGIIGHMLPVEKILAAIPGVYESRAETPAAVRDAAAAMMTTDTFPKVASREIKIGDGTVRVLGLAKGAAMIAPDMATMLGVVVTDAVLSPETADVILKTAVDDSFNLISVDGHTSTSDTVFLLANGASGVDGEGSAALASAVAEVCGELAEMIVRDAEGAEHLIELHVAGAADRDGAVTIAKAVANSALVKTAVTGNDPNWGRIVSAAGYAGMPFEPTAVSLSVEGVSVYERGTPVGFDEEAVSAAMRDGDRVRIELTVGDGPGRVRFLTSDLTAEYVRLNSEYTT
ncbi:MAG: bifunctional glutamate N-acetyltransferase/amino-acid acetyltransferase ArgJ [Planctomycetota bacterium]